MPRKLTALVLIALSGLAAADPPRIIELFCTGAPSGLDARELRGIDVRVHRLDELGSLQDALSVDLPADLEKAKKLLTSRITPDIQRRLAEAWSSQLSASRYHLTRLPAAVIDRDPSRILYGSTDLRAIAGAAAR